MKVSSQLCRVCNSPTTQAGFLYRCNNSSCKSVYWDKFKVKRLASASREEINAVLQDAKVPEPHKGSKTYYVYVIRLRGELNSVYVGMTGLHPYARYLNHLIGNRASRYARRRATALVEFEGPMTREVALSREPEKAAELQSRGYIVYGGH